MKPSPSIIKYLLWLLLVFSLFLATTLWFLTSTANGQRTARLALPVDDAYIHQDYARSLIEEHCICFNRGIPEAGLTAPLFTVFLAATVELGKVLGFGPVVASMACSAFFGLLAALLAGIIGGRNEGTRFELLPACVVSAIVLIAPYFNFSRLSGMEVTISALTILAGAYVWSLRRPLLLGLTLPLCMLSRPENLLLFAVLGLGWCMLVLFKKEKPATLLSVAIPPLVLLCAWFAYDLSVSGRPLPNTYYAKTVPLSLFRTQNLVNLISESGLGLGRSRLVPAMIFYLAGVYHILKRRSSLWPLIVYPWLFVYGVSVTREFYDIRSYSNNRYIQPIIPCLLIPLGMGLVFAWRSLLELLKKKDLKARMLGFLVLILSLALFIPIALNWQEYLVRQRKLLAENCMNIYEIHVRAGQWISKNIPENAVVAAYDVGAVRFYGDRQVLDLVGLNTHQMLDNPAYIYEQKPAYYFMPATRREREIIEQGGKEWTKYRLPGDKWVELKPVFWVEAKKYTVTSAYPNLQVLYEARY